MSKGINLDRKREGVEQPLIKGPTYAYECGYADGEKAGEAKGRRLERRWFLNYARNNFNVVGHEREFAEFEKKVAARSKRKGGRG